MTLEVVVQLKSVVVVEVTSEVVVEVVARVGKAEAARARCSSARGRAGGTTQFVRSAPFWSARQGPCFGECGGHPGANPRQNCQRKPALGIDGQRLSLRGAQRGQTVDMLGGLDRPREVPGQPCSARWMLIAVFPHGCNGSLRAACQASA